MMAGDDKKVKTDSTPKKEVPPKVESAPHAEPSKAEQGGEIAAASPSNYSRGEGQKAVSKAYRDNWNAIYGKKKTR
jgi:hypothetical protein